MRGQVDASALKGRRALPATIGLPPPLQSYGGVAPSAGHPFPQRRTVAENVSLISLPYSLKPTSRLPGPPTTQRRKSDVPHLPSDFAVEQYLSMRYPVGMKLYRNSSRINLTIIVQWLLFVVALPTLLPSNAPADHENMYFLKSGQGWQEIPFFCEQFRLIAIVNQEQIEEYITNAQPLQIQKWTSECDTNGSNRFMECTDIFGLPLNRYQAFEALHSLEDFPNRKAYEEAKRKYDAEIQLPAENKANREVKARIPIELSTEIQCRHLDHIALSCVTLHRTIYVVNLGNNKFGYRSYDFNSKDWRVSSTALDGGKMSWADEQTLKFRISFTTQTYTYQFDQPTDFSSPSPTVAVFMDDKKIQTEECRLFSMSRNELK